jgi:predicted dehydrogenase
MGYRDMARHFVQCIERDVMPTPTVRDGLAALEVSLAILESAETRQVVSVEPRAVAQPGQRPMMAAR